MKLGSKEAGKVVYKKLLYDLDRNDLDLTRTVSMQDFFNLQKYFNETRVIPRILNKQHFSGLWTMQWTHKLWDAQGPTNRYRKITIRRSKTVKQ